MIFRWDKAEDLEPHTHPSPSKRRCIVPSHHRNGSTESRISQNVTTTLEDVPHARLDTLPTEILLTILEYSLEASLVHSSRRLWYKLPPYVPYTRNLALQALMPLHRNGRQKKRALTDFQQPDDKIQLNHQAQGCVRASVFASAWFSDRQLEMTHRELLKRAIFSMCSGNDQIKISHWQMSKIQRFLKNQLVESYMPELNLRFTDDTGRKVYLRATPFSIRLESRYAVGDTDLPVMNWGDSVPAQLLYHPMTKFKASMLKKICGPYWLLDCQVPHGATRIECDQHLLSHALLDNLGCDNFHVFTTLLQIERRSRHHHDQTILQQLHLRAAMRTGMVTYLTTLLDHIWQSGKGRSVSEAELVGLIDEARLKEYPAWDKTTKILAMEIATRWKIAEVEIAGGTAVRHLRRWPPSVSITNQESVFPRIWYIPVGVGDTST